MMQTLSNKKCRGMTVLEVTVALGLLAMGFALTAQVFTVCARQQLTGEQLLAAQWEAANVLEHFAGLRYEEITSETAQAIQPSPQLKATVPDAKLHITVTGSAAANVGANSSETPPPHKRVDVEVTWPAAEDSPYSVKLTAWKFPVPLETIRPESESSP